MADWGLEIFNQHNEEILSARDRLTKITHSIYIPRLTQGETSITLPIDPPIENLNNASYYTSGNPYEHGVTLRATSLLYRGLNGFIVSNQANRAYGDCWVYILEF